MIFIGWQTDFGMVSTAEELFAYGDQYGVSDLKVNAIFIPLDAPSVTVTFYADGEIYWTETYYEGAGGEFPVIEEDETRSFIGWETAEGMLISWPDEAFGYGQELQLYAKFSYKVITVYFDPGTGTIDPMQAEYERGSDGGVKLPEPVPENETLVFSGWTLKDGGEVYTYVSDLFGIGREVYLVANYAQTGEHFGVYWYYDGEYAVLMRVAQTAEFFTFKSGMIADQVSEPYKFADNVLTVAGYTFSFDAETGTFSDGEGHILQRAEGGKLYMRADFNTGELKDLTTQKDPSWTVLTDTAFQILDENDPNVWYMIAFTEEEYASIGG